MPGNPAAAVGLAISTGLKSSQWVVHHAATRSTAALPARRRRLAHQGPRHQPAVAGPGGLVTGHRGRPQGVGQLSDAAAGTRTLPARENK